MKVWKDFSEMRKLAIGSLALLAATSVSLQAAASNGLESPDNGAYQVGRGGAWLARADDPLAVYFNPAGLVRQATGVHLGAHLMFLSRCYDRTGQSADDSTGSTTYGQYGFPVSPGGNLPGPGAPADPTKAKQAAPAAQVCEKESPFPNPQLAANFRVHPNFAFGVGVLGPHGVGASEWPEEVEFTNRFGEKQMQPSPQRYMLVSSSSRILFPILSVSYAVNDQLAIGAGFTWGVAIAEFQNFAEATSPSLPRDAQGRLARVCGPNKDQPCVAVDDFGRDVKARLNATDIFVPGFVIGVLYSPLRNLDVAGWFRWSDAVDTDANVNITADYWNKEADRCADKNNPQCTVTAGDAAGDPGNGAGHIKLAIPMEAKLGVRFHYPRQEPGPRPKWAQGPKTVRDAMSEDLFDVEMDFTYANNSANKNLEVRFKPNIAINGTGGGTLPENADIPHEWKDVFGARLGGEVVVLPSVLAARAGFFYESKGQDERYLNIDFHNGEKLGLSAGASVRLGPVDVTAAFQHTFFGALDNKGKGELYGLSGDASTATDENKGKAGGAFRTYQAVNGGKLQSDLNEVALGATLRF
jgi:long-subunit fatty acid transport protein